MEEGARRAAIVEVLGAPQYRRLFEAVRRRLETAGFEEGPVSGAADDESAAGTVGRVGTAGAAATVGAARTAAAARRSRARSVTVPALSEAERRAVADLHGWPRLPENPVVLDLGQLDTALRESALRAGLLECVEALGGPLTDRRAARREDAIRAEAMWAEAAAHPAVAKHPALGPWLAALRGTGQLTRAGRRLDGGAEVLLGLALEILARLPADPEVMLQVLATQITKDAHALDPERPLSGLVLRALAAVAKTPVPTGADERRSLWARYGVLCDALSSHVLVVGLRPAGEDAIARHLRAFADLGEPARITLRAVERFAPAADEPLQVHVCENPAIVALAADRLGPRSSPLVCTEGVPSLAVWRLLEKLREAGARFRFHADLDWSGVRIGNLLVHRLGAEPWRMSADDYGTNAAREDGVPLSGAEVGALWDAALAPSMREHGVAVLEEQVAEALVGDLEREA
jgi:uncharacterized protein (TIGR02679 family)